MNISQENKYLQLIFPTDSGLHPLPFSPIPNVICRIFFWYHPQQSNKYFQSFASERSPIQEGLMREFEYFLITNLNQPTLKTECYFDGKCFH